MASEEKVREITVTNRSRWPHYRQVPEVRLSGDWLGRAGFAAGCRLSIAVEQARLVVTVIAPPKLLPCRGCGRPREE